MPLLGRSPSYDPASTSSPERAGTKRLSDHSFATAIDLNVQKAAYWRWQPPAQLETFSRKNWSTEIIETFERHGFIWGGKW